MKTLITFVHFKNDWSKVNLDFFLKLGLTNSPEHHFNFVINSPSGGENIPIQDNISIIKGHNEGHDFGGYKQSLESVNINDFDRFIFINDTCRGPFLPEYLPFETWVDIIGNLFTDKIKLVGSTWNFADAQNIVKIDNLHIQSYFFATDLQGLSLLLSGGIFNTKNKAKTQIIKEHEIGMSRLLLKSGFKIKPLQLSQHNVEKSRDICYNGRYYGTTINPLEVMFIKTNRIQSKTINNYTKWKIQETQK